MEFLDNALSKAKEAFDVARQKTGEVVNTEKQRLDISTLKSKRSKSFKRLGELYFEKIKNDEDLSGEVKELVEDIKEKNEKINSLNEAILSAKNKRVCPVCGAGIDVNAVFCSNCGEKLVIESEE